MQTLVLLTPRQKNIQKKILAPVCFALHSTVEKTTTKTKQNILREATAKSQKSKVRIAQVSLYTERPAEFTAESSDSDNPKGNEDILFQTWCEPENDGRGT